MNAQNHRWGLGLIETYNSAAKVAVLNAKNRVEVWDTETCKSGLKIAVCDAKTTNEGWNPQRLVIPMLKSLFWMQKKWQQRRDLGPIETWNSGSKSAVLHSQVNRRSLGPIETCNSDPKVAVLHAKTTDEGWDHWRLVILILITLFWMHITTGEDWDQWRLVILALITLFCECKKQSWGLGHRDL